MSPLSRARASYRAPRLVADRKSRSLAARLVVQIPIEWSIWARLPGPAPGAPGGVTGPLTVIGAAGALAGPCSRVPSCDASTIPTEATSRARGRMWCGRDRERAIIPFDSGSSAGGRWWKWRAPRARRPPRLRESSVRNTEVRERRQVVVVGRDAVAGDAGVRRDAELGIDDVVVERTAVERLSVGRRRHVVRDDVGQQDVGDRLGGGLVVVVAARPQRRVDVHQRDDGVGAELPAEGGPLLRRRGGVG